MTYTLAPMPFFAEEPESELILGIAPQHSYGGRQHEDHQHQQPHTLLHQQEPHTLQHQQTHTQQHLHGEITQVIVGQDQPISCRDMQHATVAAGLPNAGATCTTPSRHCTCVCENVEVSGQPRALRLQTSSSTAPTQHSQSQGGNRKAHPTDLAFACPQQPRTAQCQSPHQRRGKKWRVNGRFPHEPTTW